MTVSLQKTRQIQPDLSDLLEKTREVVRLSPFIPQVPTFKQLTFLANPAREKLFGGAAGPGKSSALLMHALLGVSQPDYSAIIFRKTYSDLALPGAIMDRSFDWLAPTAAKWNGTTKTWTFPSGATLSFGYLDHESHKYRYQGAEFQFIGFDELTQFPKSQPSYLRSRLRKTLLNPVSLTFAGATNPGGVGHEWVYEEFVKSASPERVFIPALLDDNPYLDSDEYRKSLEGLDDITREQLLKGLWVQDEAGHPFKRKYWRGKNRYHYARRDTAETAAVIARWISWDTALKDTDTSAYNACIVLELLADYRLRVAYVWREKMTFPELVPVMEEMAATWDYDGKLEGVIIEDKASGTTAYQTITQGANDWLAGKLRLYDPGGQSKEVRWSQAALWCKRDCVEMPHPEPGVSEWLHPFQTELFAVPESEYKDMADAFAQGIIYLEHLVSEGYRARQAA